MNIKMIITGIIILAIIFVICTGYVKAPPDIAIIISGLKEKPRYLIGQAGIRIPFLERKDTLIVKQISVDIKTNGAIPTADFIGVDVDAVAKIKIKTDPVGIQKAMSNFLNMSENQIVEALTDSLQGNMREIIGTIPLKEICNDRKRFGDEVQEKAQTDMNALGIEIISCNIQRVEDENDLINALGQDNMEQIKKDASIAKANARKEVSIAEAEANKVANEAEVEAERIIAERNNELLIKKAELQKLSDAKRAEADAAYSIQEQEQRKSIEVATANADIAKEEQCIILKQKEASVKEQSLDAEIKKKAEADKFARLQEAEATLFERQKAAEAKKYELEQEAAGIKAKGEAEAEAIKAKAIAEAEGIEKKAEAMQKYGEAAILEMFFKAFPEAVKNAAEPLGNVESITMYGNGNNDKMVGSIMNTVTQVSDGIKGSTGLDVKSILAGMVGTKVIENETDKMKEEYSEKQEDISENEFLEEI